MLRAPSLFRLASCSAGALIVAAAILSSALPQTASAFTVTPIRVELAGDPGLTVSSEFKIYNDTNKAQTFYTSAQNFESQDETGNPVFVNTKDGLASWISLTPSVTAQPRQEVNIAFKVTVPKDAEPGGYFAGLFASTLPPATSSTALQIGSRIGTLLLFRVNGDVSEGISILEFGTSNHLRLYSRLPVNFYYRFQNSGADRIKPLGDIIVNNLLGGTSKILSANRVDGNVLPKSIRRFESAWTRGGGGEQDPADQGTPSEYGKLGFFAAAKAEWHNFAFGSYRAHLNLAYGNVTAKSAAATYTFFVFPWQLLLIILVVLLVLIFILRIFLKRYNRYIIQQAKNRR